MCQSSFYALVLDLNAPARPKIVPTSELYRLTSDMNAVKLTPKNSTDFSKNKEYGRLKVIDGCQKIVRHVIYSLSESKEELKDQFNNGKKRFVAPKRRSIAPIVEDVSAYNFPDKKRDYRAGKSSNKKQVIQNRESEESKILKKFQKGNASVSTPCKDGSEVVPRKSAPEQNDGLENIPSSSGISKFPYVKQNTIDTGNQPKKDNVPKKSDEETFTSHNKTIPHKDMAKCNTSKPPSDENTTGLGVEYGLQEHGPKVEMVLGLDIEDIKITDKDLTDTAMSVIDENRKARNELPRSDIMRHTNLQKDLNEALTKLEDAAIEIGRLKAQLADMEFLKKTVAEMKDTLSLVHELASGKGNQVVDTPRQSCIGGLQNLVSDDDDDEVVPEGQMKVDCGHYISAKEVLSIEKKTPFKTRRIEMLCDLFFENKAGNYSLGGWSASGNALIKITDAQLKSMMKILQAMTWDSELSLTKKGLRTRVSRYTSQARCEVVPKNVDKKIAGAQKRSQTQFRNPHVKKPKLSDDSSADEAAEDNHEIGGDHEPDEDDREEKDLETSITL